MESVYLVTLVNESRRLMWRVFEDEADARECATEKIENIGSGEVSTWTANEIFVVEAAVWRCEVIPFEVE